MEQKLEVFVKVAEKESFSRAAEELHMTQPAVSQYIQQFEREMGTKLLERSNKYVRLNKAGEIVYHHAKEIIGLYTKMQRLVDDVTNKTSGPLSIGASYTFGEYVLPHIIAHTLEKYPLIKPTITIGNTKEIAELVTGNQLDIGIIEGGLRNSKLKLEPFLEDEMYVVVSSNHRLATIKKEIVCSELANETWIVRENGSGTREATEHVFQLFGISPTVMKFGSNQLIKESVEAGLGVSLLSQWATRKEVELGTLKILKVKGLPFKRQFSIIVQTPFHTKSMDSFLNLLRADDLLSNIEKDRPKQIQS
ncbi:LysR family transcriptional regulator [Bacillus sp. FJAT-49711]|uniref:LysR family transcriptional regulator n=1 Tax=Bacillus sp. FJAT-49711 TaxID=2833585 RepID=UPI001BC9C1F0|nr:LysR family transcriptional regulator [Bacillus sp. FJAT-49711]MBS4219709.1 LysR family transcriptional regulator [Bacillus sp. FJAT-49711]